MQAGPVIELFRAAPLFRHIGKPIADARVQLVHDWEAAIRPRVAGPGDELYDVLMNRIRTLARSARGETWFNAEWNPMVQALKPDIERQLRPVVEPLLRAINGAPIVEAHVYADVLQACLIAEFPDPASRPWLDWHMHWYCAGHFPAGWVGELPPEEGPDPDRLPELYRDGTLYVY